MKAEMCKVSQRKHCAQLPGELRAQQRKSSRKCSAQQLHRSIFQHWEFKQNNILANRENSIPSIWDMDKNLQVKSNNVLISDTLECVFGKPSVCIHLSSAAMDNIQDLQRPWLSCLISMQKKVYFMAAVCEY